MEEKNKSSIIDFVTAKEYLIKELSKEIEQDKLPKFYPEKNEIKIEFEVEAISPEDIIQSIQILKTYIENLRIHSIDSNFFVIQAMNENLFEMKSILDNIKFRFISMGNQKKIDISKKGDLQTGELYAVILLCKYFSKTDPKKNLNPKDILQKLGVTVFLPEEERLKGNNLGFENIAGYESVKQEIRESIIMPLKNPEAFDEVSKLTRKFPSLNRPRAVLFEGDPGVGKTSMAKIVSFLCDLPLIYVPIESILSKYYGESSQNLAQVFDAAALYPSALIFLDEIDSLAGSREEGIIEATRKLLSVLLRKLDGFEGKPRTMTIGATNRKQDLDKALLSRFDRSIYFPLPNTTERAAIIQTYSIQLEQKEVHELSKSLEGFSGRNIKDFCDRVERKWASELIEKKLNITAPTFEKYKEVLEFLQKP